MGRYAPWKFKIMFSWTRPDFRSTLQIPRNGQAADSTIAIDYSRMWYRLRVRNSMPVTFIAAFLMPRPDSPADLYLTINTAPCARIHTCIGRVLFCGTSDELL